MAPEWDVDIEKTLTYNLLPHLSYAEWYEIEQDVYAREGRVHVMTPHAIAMDYEKYTQSKIYGRCSLAPGSHPPNEYGIAMWTPRVFRAWAVDGDRNGTKDYMSAPDAIATMGAYLCWVDEQLKKHGMHGDLPALTAASYRTSTRTIEEAGGVPARVQPYIDKVHRYLADYTPARR